MANELGRHGIRVNAVNPTVVLTPMAVKAWSDPAKSGPMLQRIPLGRFVQPEEVAEAIAYLLGDGAAMVNGVTLPVDGGFLIN
jgi:NAD(P)-dependent dehydrogenase (short-subunit alcohol dehydrogenase family)